MEGASALGRLSGSPGVPICKPASLSRSARKLAQGLGTFTLRVRLERRAGPHCGGSRLGSGSPALEPSR
jgi:hypothetical protein